MGMALATKQTSIIVLLPFLLYGGYRLYKSTIKVKLIAMICLAIVPSAFAVRTMLKTGSPVYPVHQISFLVKDHWRFLPPPEEIQELNDRDSDMHLESNYGLAKHIGIYLMRMEGLLLLMVGGLAVALLKRDHSWLLFLPVLLYFAVAVVVLWPPWWGVKYTILIFPFIALLGVKSMQSKEKFSSAYLLVICLLSFTVPGYLVSSDMFYSANFRFSLAKSVLTGKWDTSAGYKFNISSSEGMTQMWLNSYLLQDSRILSLHEEKRYFCDHQIFVGWRHPATQSLYLENTIEEECAILDDLEIDYVTFYRPDPSIASMENRLVMLNHIGRDDILEPVIAVSGNYLVCRYNSPAEQEQQH